MVLFVPFYEEVLFRGIILSSTEKHIKFIWANILQALIFALIHQELPHIIFYFSFGLIAGYLRQRTFGLAASIFFHVTNNLIAFIQIMVL